MQPMLLSSPIRNVDELPKLMERALNYAVDSGLCNAGKEVVVLSSTNVTGGTVSTGGASAGDLLLQREMFVTRAPGKLDLDALGALAPMSSIQDPRLTAKTITFR